MKKQEIEGVILRQREWLDKGHSAKSEFRIKALVRLKKAIIKFRPEIHLALCRDLGIKDEYYCFEETQDAIELIDKNIRRHMLLKRTVKPDGVALIMTPWFSPFISMMTHMVDAIIRGDTIIIKASSKTKETSEVVSEMVGSAFPDYYVKVIYEGRNKVKSLTNLKFDRLYFSGVKETGRKIIASAYENFTPVNLDICDVCVYIVKKGDNLRREAINIADNKFAVCGQYADAIDFVVVEKDVEEKFLAELVHKIETIYGSDPFVSDEYGRIWNKEAYKRIEELTEGKETVYGGAKCEKTLQIGPVVIKADGLEDKILEDKIFGPVLPIVALEYDEIKDFEI